MAEDPKPTLEEAPAESTGAEETAEIDVDAVMKELEAIGKKTPEEVRNMHTASVQTGRYANEVGELRKKIERMEAERQAPKANPNDYYEGESVDLGQLIRKEVMGVYQDIQSQQAQAYQRQMEEINSIYADEDYNLVKDVWEEHAKNPNTVMKINSGQTSYAREYDRVVRSYLRSVAKRSKEALDYATKGGKKKPPHVEQGAPPPPIEEAEDTRTKVRKVADASHGSDDDIDKMIEAVLPKGDPIFRAE